jgi:hypothetical protein
MIFATLKTESILQINDKTRIDATQSFVSKGSAAIQTVEIEPESGSGFLDITGTKSSDWYLDWAYQTAGSKTVTLRIFDGVDTVTQSKDIEVRTLSQDGLWSNDQDLVANEYDIIKWLPSGKSSWNHIHRKAQEYILDWLNSIRVWKNDGTKLTKSDLPETEDLRQLSKYWTLETIFGQLSNRTDDIFNQKMIQYREMRVSKQNTNWLAIDENGDGEVEQVEKKDLRTTRLIRR